MYVYTVCNVMTVSFVMISLMTGHYYSWFITPPFPFFALSFSLSLFMQLASLAQSLLTSQIIVSS